MPDGKNHALLGTKYRLDGTHGLVINTDHERVAQMVNDYDPTLRICWIPPNTREPQDVYPWALVHSPVGLPEYVVCNFAEDEMRSDIIMAAIFRNDAAKHGNVLSVVESQEAAREIEAAKKREEIKQEKIEFGRSVLKSKLHAYKHGGVVYR